MRKKIKNRGGQPLLLILFCLFFTIFNTAAQTYPKPVAQREVCFFYQEWSITNKSTDPKVLVISSHLYRFNPNSRDSDFRAGNGFENFKDQLQLSVDAVENQMEFDERLPGNQSHHSVGPYGSRGVEWAFWWQSVRSEATGPELYTQYTNTTQHLLAIREAIIKEYRDNGYTIFQVDFSAEVEDSFDTSEMERVEKLSPLYITPYRKGVIKKISEDHLRKNERSEPESEDEEEFDPEEYKAKVCGTEKIKAAAAIERARSEQTLESWFAARAALDNFNSLCQNVYYKEPDWETEVNNGLASAQLAQGLESVAAVVTGMPWSYGYGRFLDTENDTYIHRFNVGLAGGYSNQMVSIDLSIMSNLMKLPTHKLISRFVADDGSKWNTAPQSRDLNDLQVFSISIGPAITFWPQKNIFLQVIPELNVGMQFGDRDKAPVEDFTAFPGLNGKLGFRIGRVYLSGTYGMIWKGFASINEELMLAPEPGSINTVNGIVEGTWVPESFDDGKVFQHTYWLLSLGLYLGEN